MAYMVTQVFMLVCQCVSLSELISLLRLCTQHYTLNCAAAVTASHTLRHANSQPGRTASDLGCKPEI